MDILGYVDLRTKKNLTGSTSFTVLIVKLCICPALDLALRQTRTMVLILYIQGIEMFKNLLLNVKTSFGHICTLYTFTDGKGRNSCFFSVYLDIYLNTFIA